MTTLTITTAIVSAGVLLLVFAPNFCADFVLAVIACA